MLLMKSAGRPVSGISGPFHFADELEGAFRFFLTDSLQGKAAVDKDIVSDAGIFNKLQSRFHFASANGYRGNIVIDFYDFSWNAEAHDSVFLP